MATGEIKRLIIRIIGEDDELARALRRSGAGLDDLGRRAQRLGGDLSKYVTAPLIAAGAGLFALATRAASSAAEIEAAALRTGLSHTALQELGYAANQAGTSLESVTGSIGGFARRMPGIIQGGTSAARVMDELGVSVEGADGELRDMGEIFPEVLTALAGVPHETERTALAFQVLGRRAMALEPLFEQGADGIQELTSRAHELGLVLEDSAIRDLSAYHSAMAELREQGSALGRDLALTVLPVLRDDLIPFLREHAVPWFERWLGVARNLDPAMVRKAASIAAVAAALPPLIAGVGTATRALGGLVRGVALLKGVGALGGLAALLTPGGVLLAGLGLIAAGFVQTRMAAIDASMAVARLRAEVSNLTFIEAIRELAEARRELERLEEVGLPDLEYSGGSLGVPTRASVDARQQYREDLEAARVRVEALEDQVIETGRAEVEMTKATREASEEFDGLLSRMGEGRAESAEAADEIDRVAASLEQLEERKRVSAALAELLGERYNETQERVRILRAALEDLLTAGLEPGDEEVQAITAELREANEELERLSETVRTGAEELEELGDVGAETADDIADALGAMARRGEDALVDMVARGKLELGDLARYALSTFARLGIGVAVRGLVGAFTGGAGFAAGAGAVTGFAARGARFGPGERWIVGEEGPEVIETGSSSGAIRPIEMQPAASGAAGASAQAPITIHVPAPPPAGNPLAAARDADMMRFVSDVLREIESAGAIRLVTTG